MRKKETNIISVEEARLPTYLDPEKAIINAALTEILERFQKPLTNSFSRRIGNVEKAEERFADFTTYLIEHRKRIFGNYDPTKGSLQSYIYKIAHRFLARSKNTNKISIDDIADPPAVEFTPDQWYEAECANTLVNLAIKELSVKNPESYQILTCKYLSDEKLTYQGLAIKLGKLEEGASAEELKRVKNIIDQQMAKAKKEMLGLLKKHLQQNPLLEDKEIDLEEDMQMLKKYIPWINLQE